MANFQYRAKDQSGQDIKGQIESADLRSATLVLRKKGLVVISLSLRSDGGKKLFDKYFNRVSFNELVIFTRQFATMIGAGLAITQTLDILAEQNSNKKLKLVLTDVANDIKGGLSLYQALLRHPDVFPSLYNNLVRSGETSGKLDVVLLRMADSLEKEREFKARVKGALIYPAVVVSMMVLVMIIMITFVIPKLTVLYKESTLDLPLPTKILIGVSDFFVGFWWLLLAILVIAVVALRRWSKTEHGGLALDNLTLRLPIIGKISTYVTLANFSRTFGLLVSAGIPLLEGINIVEDVTPNLVFRNALKSAYRGVERGLAFSAQLILLPVFPKIVGQMAKVGEETGKVDEVFFKLADYFESESDHMVKNLTVAIEPLILVILGIGVAFLVISIILPIYKLTTSF